MVQIAVFASGAGSNALKLIEYFNEGNHSKGRIALIVCNNVKAGVLKIAEEKKIPTLLLDKEVFFKGDAYANELKAKNITLIVLAGFLWKVPVTLINAFTNKIINIHPALLPQYGGKGMYGMHVHNAVIANKEKQSGITIHYVNEKYDDGEHIAQYSCTVLENDTPESLAQKIHVLEHLHYAKVIDRVINNSNMV
jgi:phosphoribosylglycinamide formyltransferase-1